MWPCESSQGSAHLLFLFNHEPSTKPTSPQWSILFNLQGRLFCCKSSFKKWSVYILLTTKGTITLNPLFAISVSRLRRKEMTFQFSSFMPKCHAVPRGGTWSSRPSSGGQVWLTSKRSKKRTRWWKFSCSLVSFCCGFLFLIRNRLFKMVIFLGGMMSLNGDVF